MAWVEGKMLPVEGRGHGRQGVIECKLEAHISACIGIKQMYSTDATINTCSFPALLS